MAKLNVKILGLFILILTISAVIGITLLKNPILINTEPEGIEVTVYNSDLGVVKEYRTKFLNKGLNDVLYESVASRIDPTSVRLKSLKGEINILEQNFQYDLVSREKILERYIDKEISAYQIYGDNKEIITGKLLSFTGDHLVIQDSEGKIQILSSNNLLLPKLPEGLITKPTLEWILESSEDKNHTLELSYMTSGMGWSANYVAVVNNDDSKLDLNGWVTVTNNAGMTFKDASLKLVAGDIHRTSVPTYGGISDYTIAEKAITSQFAEEKLFEYHMYDLKGRTTLRNNEQKQISLMSADNVNAEKEYVYENSYGWYYGSGSSNKVNVMLNFNNTEKNNLGIALPKGTVRVFKKDSDGKLQFIGEDNIDHTPKDEIIRIFVGQAFDVLGERKQMDYKAISDRVNEYTWEITLKNHKDSDIVVTVLENTGGDWEIMEENYKHIKESNNRIKWMIPVKSNSESKLNYTIRYKW